MKIDIEVYMLRNEKDELLFKFKLISIYIYIYRSIMNEIKFEGEIVL